MYTSISSIKRPKGLSERIWFHWDMISSSRVPKYVCPHTHARARTRTHIHTLYLINKHKLKHTHTRRHTHTHTNTPTHTHTHTHIQHDLHVHVHVCVCVYARVYMCLCVCPMVGSDGGNKVLSWSATRTDWADTSGQAVDLWIQQHSTYICVRMHEIVCVFLRARSLCACACACACVR